MSCPCVTNLELKSKDRRGLVFQLQKGDRWNIPCTELTVSGCSLVDLAESKRKTSGVVRVRSYPELPYGARD